MSPSRLVACATLASLSLLTATAVAQPETPPETPETPAGTPGAAEPGALPAPDAAPSEGSPAPAAGEPAAPATPPPTMHAVPWYPQTGAPPAQYQPPPAEEQDTGPSRDMSRDFWQVYAGVRTTWVTNEGYDPFDENDGFTQSSIGASRAIVLGPSLSFAPGVVWEFGAVESEARGARSELYVHRLGAVAEGRFHLGRDVYVLGKLVPQAVHTRAYLDDASMPLQLQQRTWRFGLDASAGAAWNAFRTFGSANMVPQFWFIGEVGYGWTSSKNLEMSPDLDEDDPRASTTLDLGPMALSGITMRLSAAITF